MFWLLLVLSNTYRFLSHLTAYEDCQFFDDKIRSLELAEILGQSRTALADMDRRVDFLTSFVQHNNRLVDGSEFVLALRLVLCIARSWADGLSTIDATADERVVNAHRRTWVEVPGRTTVKWLLERTGIDNTVESLDCPVK